MKTVIKILIFAFAIQVTLAGPISQHVTNTSNTSENPGAMADKRYKLFKNIFSITYEILRQDLLEMVKNHDYILHDYNEWLITQNDSKAKIDDKSYQDLQQNIQQLLTDVKILQKDSTNCELQRKIQNEYFAVETQRIELKNTELNQIWTKYKTNRTHEMNPTVQKCLADLTAAVDEFMKDLSESEKKDNSELITTCEKFLKAKSYDEKTEAFEELRDLFEYEVEKELTSADPDCKVVVQMEMIAHILSIVVLSIFSLFT